MTTRGDLLREHFPPELVKQRPGAAIGAHRDSCEKQRCRETRDPAKHMQFDYVEDEAVMDRLDSVLGLGAWSWKVEPVADGVVKGILVVRWDTGEASMYEDFGYSANGLEPYKEASTDAFRRCGRMVGVARYIYAGEVGASAPPRPSPAPRHAPAPEPEDGPPLTWDELPAVAAAVLDASAAPWLCPIHSEPWKHFSGTSKSTGRAYDFWGCPKGRECKELPSADWVREQEG